LDQWLLEPGAAVTAGEILAWIRPTPDAIELARVESLLAETDRALREAVTRSRQAFEQEGDRLRQQIDAAERRGKQARQQRPTLLAAYEHAKTLADQGVLAYREIRPEWQRLEDLDHKLAEAEAERLHHAEDLARWRKRPWQEEQVAPDLQAQRKILAARRQTALDGPARLPLLAPSSGWLLLQAEVGASLVAGQLLAQLQVEEHARVEVLLPTASWSPDYLQGSARLRQQGQDGSWMPTRIESATSRPDGSTLLQLRLPVGWLALDPEQHGQATWGLDCRMTAPIGPAVAEEAQPSVDEAVEFPR